MESLESHFKLLLYGEKTVLKKKKEKKIPGLSNVFQTLMCKRNTWGSSEKYRLLGLKPRD